MSKLCNCIALYDFTPSSANLKDWFAYMEQWAEQIQLSWLTMSHPSSKKLIQFKNGRKKIDKNGFDNLNALGLHGGVAEPGTSMQWKTIVEFDFEAKTLYLCYREIVSDFDQSTIQNLFVDLLPFADFKYGIGYQRDYAKGPEWYPFGYLQEEDDPKERKKIGDWNRCYNFVEGKYRTGLLRDVYPYNVLVDTHLQQSIHDTTFEAWIHSDPRHGQLVKMTDQHWLWSVASDDIPTVQHALYPTGLLLCYWP